MPAHGGIRPAAESASTYVARVNEIISRMKVRVEKIALAQILRILKVTSPKEVRVGTFMALGMAANAEEVASLGSGRTEWGAVSERVRFVIDERDAALLIANGAHAVQDSDLE